MFTFLPHALAQADADVLSIASTTAQAFKENIIGVLQANISTILSVGLVILAIYFIWSFGKRMVRGK